MFVLFVFTKCKLDQIKAKFWMTSRFKFFKNSHWRDNVVTGTEVQLVAFYHICIRGCFETKTRLLSDREKL